jgi:hypothetical protein
VGRRSGVGEDVLNAVAYGLEGPASLSRRVGCHSGDIVPGVVHAHDLSSPYQFWRAAHALVEEGRIEDALGWLERGQAAYPDSPDSRLAELAADLHARAGRPEAATGIAWQQFAERPSLSGYQRLHTFATAAGTWVQRREQALEVLRAQPKASASNADVPRPRPAWGEPAGHSVLVDVLMWENDIDGA